MKTIKFILATIMMMVAFTVQAQTVQVYKDGAVVKEYPASEVKDVQVKQVYYYYAGWECPTNEEELARLAVAIDKNGTAMGGQFDSLEGLDTNKNYYPNPVYGPYDKWYIVIPSTLNCYDYYSGGKMTDDKLMFKKINVIGNHSVWQSTDDNKTDEYYNLKIY